ncbi:MAG TPA: FecR domain-containing protein [Pseudomonas sp.]|jgi:transmembrane sensor|uniref:FecR family protein n=1 Tax=Pseudomonas sp. TaxID=306 RepID=UPI002EDB36CE
MNPENARKKPPAQDALHPFADALREQVPSREALLNEAKAFSQRRRKTRTALGTGLLTLALLGAIWKIDPAWQTEDVWVAKGTRQQLQLRDGSQVSLDSGTHLRIERRLRSRQLELVEGQALFSVVHADTPFIVRSQGVEVRDIGTVFSVRSDQRGVDVAVLEGVVEVSNARSPALRLEAGQQLRASAERIDRVQGFNKAQLTAWQNGKLRFDGTPLKDVVVDVGRYRQAPVRIADARTGELRLSGEFDIDSVESLLNLLPSILPVAVQRAPDGAVTLSRTR